MKSKPNQSDLFDATDPDWPPDPMTLNMNDAVWLTVPQAAYLARTTERNMWRMILKRDIAIRVFDRVWVNRRRMFSQ